MRKAMMAACGAVFAVAFAADAYASSPTGSTGCRYVAEVKGLTDTKGQLTLDLAVLVAEPFGSSPSCKEPASVMVFAPDDDADVRAAGVAIGDKIRVEEVAVGTGKKASQAHDFLEKLPDQPAEPPPPTEPMPPAETTPPAEPTPPTTPAPDPPTP